MHAGRLRQGAGQDEGKRQGPPLEADAPRPSPVQPCTKVMSQVLSRITRESCHMPSSQGLAIQACRLLSGER